jgi:acetyl esterase/lipase
LYVQTWRKLMDSQPDLTHPRTLFNTAVFATKTANSFVLGQDPPYANADMLAVVPPDFPPTAIWAAMNDTLIPVKHSFMLADKLKEAGIEVRLEQVQAEHGFTDLPAKYFEKDAPGWWTDHIVPVLEWALKRLEE